MGEGEGLLAANGGDGMRFRKVIKRSMGGKYLDQRGAMQARQTGVQVCAPLEPTTQAPDTNTAEPTRVRQLMCMNRTCADSCANENPRLTVNLVLGLGLSPTFGRG